ncbi:MAG: ribosome biogenesis GTPase Der [Bacillota bacterium]|nr:ribosome biogenesis GTPase Der [Bacillota bacterium]
MSRPLVALVGRPNVGKSALFNRIIGQRRSIVEETPGVTRDPVYAEADWAGREMVLVDTGGMAEGGIDLAREVREQAEAAVAAADLVILVVDVTEGLHPLDEEVADFLRRAGKAVLVAAGKADNAARAGAAAEFHRLGLGDPLPVSALHGRGVGDLLDRVVSLLPVPAGEPPAGTDQAVRVAVVGRPNAGKSSLVNALLGEKRLIVSEVPGTTRDTVDCLLRRGERAYVLVDTAGVRRPDRVGRTLERYAVMRALRAIDRAHVAILVIDATLGVVQQDQRLAGYIHESGRALVVALNKWDLVAGPESPEVMARAAARLSFVAYAPLWAVSARTGRGLTRLLGAVDRVAAAYRREVAASALARFLADAVARTPPPGGVRIPSLKQVASAPPTFVVTASDPDAVPASYRRYLETRLREAFEWEGAPLRMIWRPAGVGMSTRTGRRI